MVHTLLEKYPVIDAIGNPNQTASTVNRPLKVCPHNADIIRGTQWVLHKWMLSNLEENVVRYYYIYPLTFSSPYRPPLRARNGTSLISP